MRRNTKFTIKYWTVFVPDVVNIPPNSRFSSSTLRSGAKSAPACGLHLGFQRITETSKGWINISTHTRDLMQSVQRQVKIWIDRKDAPICKSCRTGTHFVGEGSRCCVIQQQNWSGWTFACSQILHCVLESQIQIHQIIGQRSCRLDGTNMELRNNWIRQPEKCNSCGSYYQVLQPLTSRSIFRHSWMGKIHCISVNESYSCIKEVAAFATTFKLVYWCSLEPASENTWWNGNSNEPPGKWDIVADCWNIQASYFPPDISSERAIIAWTKNNKILIKTLLASNLPCIYSRVCQLHETGNQVRAPRRAEDEEQIDLDPGHLTLITQHQRKMPQVRGDPLLKLTVNHETLIHKASEQAAIASTVKNWQFYITNESVMYGNSLIQEFSKFYLDSKQFSPIIIYSNCGDWSTSTVKTTRK